MSTPHSLKKNSGQGAAPKSADAASLRLVAPIHMRTSTATCWKCHALTQVHAVVAADVVDLGESGESRTYVYGISNPPTELTDALLLLAPNLRVDVPSDDGVSRLTNHCPHCGALQSDVYLFSEPGGPFFGRPPEGHLGAVILEHDVQVDDASYST
ncbi:hypothetical protein [Aquabacterium sp. CECT 9606]|uniref:hypothetical protein n=1 Tax=Aquabacterium sp. CECT 9606 TaxID=2845822 RepID=UPI001E624C5A|nr:hypothetical protein [Aquabacterium sp. CECT 9606]CAH0348385.1 hypothetical protein AQB9606_00535 [Aquabacterium sp. CECT 9606]